jgi:hypothetical protein
MAYRFLMVGLGVLAMCGVAANSQAGSIFVDPVSATDNGSYPGAPSSNTIDGASLSDGGASVATGQPVPPALGYPTVTTGPNAANFYQNYAVQPPGFGGPLLPEITYTLDKAYTINGGHFWQYTGDTTPNPNGSGARSLISADIYTSPTGLAGSYTLSGTLIPGYVEGPYGTQDPGVNFSLTPVSNVKFIQLQNIIGVPNEYIAAAFDEIRFTAPSVPEPTSLALLGLSALALLALRRRA